MGAWHIAIIVIWMTLNEKIDKTDASKVAALNEAIDVVDKVDQMLTKKMNAHYDAVAVRPKSLIGPGDLGEIAKNMKSGKEISFQEMSGFDGIQEYQAPGWKVAITDHTEEKQPEGEDTEVFTYPMGVGNLLMSGCFGSGYTETDPCYQFTPPAHICVNQLDAANFIGVGFDITKSYTSESRKKSVIQRICYNEASFYGGDIPDNMNAFGVYDYSVSTHSFQSVDAYRSYLAKKSGTSMSASTFAEVARKFQTVHAASFSAGLIDIGYSQAKGGETSNKFGTQNSASLQEQNQATSTGTTNEFLAVLEADIKLYEIALDHSNPSDLSETFLRDFALLPTSYYRIGADVKLQDFVLRYGTHYIKTAKFGGKLSIFKKSKESKKMNEEQFSQAAESEFAAMMSTMKNSYTQRHAKVSFFGAGYRHSSSEQDSSASQQDNTKNAKAESGAGSQSTSTSEFTETTVEALGGSPEIAAAIMDFYSPSFRSRFVDWLNSIEEFPKPYDMTFGRIPELLDISAGQLFNKGNHKAGCLNDNLEVDDDGRKYFVQEESTQDANNQTIVTSKTIFCKYGSDRKKFMEEFKAKRLALERAITIYMAEGPFSTSSFEILGGKDGCELETLDYVSESVKQAKSWPNWKAMVTKEFKIVFRLPFNLPMLRSDQEFSLKMMNGFWYTKIPGYHYTIDNMCSTPLGFDPTNRVCVANILMVYFPELGLFRFDQEYYKNLHTLEANITKSFGNHFVAHAEVFNVLKSLEENKLGEIPCNIKWSNHHRIDPSSKVSCIHFSAASKGDIFIVFASIPKDHSTWYYLQLSPKGVSFYKAMILQKRDVSISSGTLGDEKLFEAFFVCIHQGEEENFRISYGKAPAKREVGIIHATYQFPSSRTEKVSFYTFASGEDKVTVDDVRVVKGGPDDLECSAGLIKTESGCSLDCDRECLTCSQPRDPKFCSGPCRNVKHFYEKGKFICLNKCPPGYEEKKESGQNVCRPCNLGFHKENTGNENCVKCGLGTYAASKGMKKCTPCPAGKYQDAKGKSSCKNCATGHYQPSSGKTTCIECSKGYYQNEEGKPLCSKCPVGEYQDKEGETNCKKCGVGTYAPVSATVMCLNCKIGFIALEKGMSKCAPCSLGHMCPTADKKIPCGRDTYQSKKGQAKCIPCPGSLRSAPQSVSCASNACTKGQYLDGYTCKTCTMGSIAEAIGVTSCLRCATGFTSNDDRTECIDVNECLSKNGGCEHRCENEKGSRRCICNAGFHLAPDKKSCNDVDECGKNKGGCDHECKNSEGSYQCICNSGYQLASNKRTCEDVNECNTNKGGCQHKCINGIGTYGCVCNMGYELDSNKKNCSDIDECLNNKGGCEYACKNLPGTYECYCQNGYKLHSNKKDCVKICQSGYELDSYKRNCIDIDECKKEVCAWHGCKNLPGTYQCDCARGYKLGSNKRDCIDIDECANNKGGCEHGCENFGGSYRCFCQEGDKLDSTKQNCIKRAMKWREDKRCGSNYKIDGEPSICNPLGGMYCCSRELGPSHGACYGGGTCNGDNYKGVNPSGCPTFVDGDGIGGSGSGEEKISDTLTGEECIKACIKKRETDSSINGVTLYKSGGGCVCEKNMEKAVPNPYFKSCLLKRQEGKTEPLPANAITFLTPRVNKRNTLLRTLPKLYRAYTVMFDFNPKVFQEGTTNIIHLTTGGDCCNYGYRIPAVWLHSANSGTTKNRLHICSAVNGQGNYCWNSDYIVPRGQWTTIVITQQLESNRYRYTVKVGNVKIGSVINTQPRDFSNVKVYASDNWYDTAQGSIRNLIIIPNTQDSKVKLTFATTLLLFAVFLFALF